MQQWEGLVELLGSESQISGGLDFLHKYLLIYLLLSLLTICFFQKVCHNIIIDCHMFPGIEISRDH